MGAFTYVLRCADGTLYTGWTNDLERRLAAHNRGKGGKYTRCRRPVELAYVESFAEAAAARKRECAIKKLNRRQKETLLQKNRPAAGGAAES